MANSISIAAAPTKNTESLNSNKIWGLDTETRLATITAKMARRERKPKPYMIGSLNNKVAKKYKNVEVVSYGVGVRREFGSGAISANAGRAVNPKTKFKNIL